MVLRKTRISRFTLMILGLVLAGGAWAQASNKEVAILYNGNTPANSDGIHFLEHQFQDRSSFHLVPTQNPQELVPGKFRAILILNTGLTVGIDRKLADFVAGWSDKSKLILISLAKGSQDLTVTSLKPSEQTLGLDAVAAASKWEGRGFLAFFGGKPTPSYEMHVEWVNRVLGLLNRLN